MYVHSKYPPPASLPFVLIGIHVWKPSEPNHTPPATHAITATYVDGLALPPEWGRMKMYRIDRGRAAPAVEADEAQAHDFSWRVRE